MRFTKEQEIEMRQTYMDMPGVHELFATLDAQFCSDWLKGEIRKLFEEIRGLREECREMERVCRALQ